MIFDQSFAIIVVILFFLSLVEMFDQIIDHERVKIPGEEVQAHVDFGLSAVAHSVGAGGSTMLSTYTSPSPAAGVCAFANGVTSMGHMIDRIGVGAIFRFAVLVILRLYRRDV